MGSQNEAGSSDPLEPLSEQARDAQDRRDYAHVEDARASARVLKRLAWVAGALAIVAFAVVAWQYFVSEALTEEQALSAAGSVGFLTLLTGATAYGTGSNLDINSSRFEREIRRTRDERR